MKICLLGTSHIAPVSATWEGGLKAKNPNHSITFFGAPGTQILGLKNKANKLVPNNDKLAENFKITSGGHSFIEPRLFDIFVVMGLCRDLHMLGTIIGGGYSIAVTTQSLVDYWKCSNLLRMVKRVRAATGSPIFAAHNPLQSEHANRAVNKVSFGEIIQISNAVAFSNLGAELIGQPSETIVRETATATRFSENALRLAVKGRPAGTLHDTRETRHMNQAFGHLWLSEFLLKLDTN
ncbi:MAG: hypothetical protein GXP05_13950 [Alphaproteobacteria bacterium]|nr:hypothetical protein [Alphaproteobacteria bacterium]